MPRTKKKYIYIHKPMPVLTDNDVSADTVETMATAEQPESVLSQETVEKTKRCAKNVMSADTEGVLIEWIREAPCFYQKGLRDYRDTQKISRPWAEKTAEMDMTGELFFCHFKFFFNF